MCSLAAQKMPFYYQFLVRNLLAADIQPEMSEICCRTASCQTFVILVVK